SLSVAFALWGHRMAIEYLTITGGAFAETLLPQLRAGTTPRVSAMAPGFKNFAGAGDVGLWMQYDDDGSLRVSGRLDWASNLYSDAMVVAPAYAPTNGSGARQEGSLAVTLHARG